MPIATAFATQVQAEVLVEEGYRQLDLGQYTAAGEYFIKALAADPGSLAGHEGLMWIYHDIGKTEKSMLHADAIRSLAPDDMGVLRYWMVVAATVPERQVELLSAAERLESEVPDDINTLVFIAKTLSSSDIHRQRGLQIYDKLFQEDPDNPDVLLGLALRAKYDGDLITAQEYLENAARNYPENSEIHAELNTISKDAMRLRSAARIGPTLFIVITIAVLPLLFGALIRQVTTRTYIVIAAYTTTISIASLCWLFMVPLN